MKKLLIASGILAIVLASFLGMYYEMIKFTLLRDFFEMDVVLPKNLRKMEEERATQAIVSVPGPLPASANIAESPGALNESVAVNRSKKASQLPVSDGAPQTPRERKKISEARNLELQDIFISRVFSDMDKAVQASVFQYAAFLRRKEARSSE